MTHIELELYYKYMHHGTYLIGTDVAVRGREFSHVEYSRHLFTYCDVRVPFVFERSNVSVLSCALEGTRWNT